MRAQAFHAWNDGVLGNKWGAQSEGEKHQSVFRWHANKGGMLTRTNELEKGDARKANFLPAT